MSSQPNLSQNLSKLNQTLKQIDDRLDKMSSFKQNFWLSMVRGLGLAIGGTIVLSFIIAVLIRVLSTISTLPVLEKLINQQVIQQIQQTQP